MFFVTSRCPFQTSVSATGVLFQPFDIIQQLSKVLPYQPLWYACYDFTDGSILSGKPGIIPYLPNLFVKFGALAVQHPGTGYGFVLIPWVGYGYNVAHLTNFSGTLDTKSRAYYIHSLATSVHPW